MDLKQDVQDIVTRAKEKNYSIPLRKFEALPSLYSENHIDYPIDLTRISPFKCLKRGQKRSFEKRELFKNQFGRIEFEGRELGVDDEDVWMVLLREAREMLFAKSNVVELRLDRKEFLRKLKRTAGGRQVSQLLASLDRLSGAKLRMENKRFKLFGTLLSKVGVDNETGKIVIRINEDWGQFFMFYGGCTQIDYKQRQELSGDITKKLHAYLQGQKNKEKNYQHVFNLDTVRSITHSQTSDKELKRLVKKALKQLEKVAFLMTWREEESSSFFVRVYPK